MKIIHCDKNTRGESINFVDVNNIFVGYDLGQDCCEIAGYFFTHEIPIEVDKESKYLPEELDKYNFDKRFFRQEDFNKKEYDYHDVAIFRLVHEDNYNEIFLCLFNMHNGYYSHGFEMKDKDIEKTLHQGDL